MKDVANERRAIAADVEVENKMSRRMAASGQNVDEFVEAMRPGHQIGAPGFDHRPDALTERAELRRRGGGVVVEVLEVIEIELGEHVARVGKRWQPLAVLELRVPADVVVMQMRAHHQ